MSEPGRQTADAAKLADEATRARFAHRLATADQRNGYEVGWMEGYLAALATPTNTGAPNDGR
jgi:hypothetical protein